MMKRGPILMLLCGLILWTGLTGLAQDAIELRFLCFNERNECDVYADLLSRFSEENAGIAVDLEVLPEAEILPALAAQVEAGAPPDIARITDLDAFEGHYLDLRSLLADPANLREHFPDLIFRSMSGGFQNIGLYGYPDAAAVVAPFVNVSLFERAGVSLPAEGASWDEWLAALDAVVDATDADYVLSVDNKDHRLVGPAMSLGADFLKNGLFRLADDDGLREFLLILHGLMEAGKTPADTLLGTGKSQDYFVRGETVMYICGSWKVEEVAAQVGHAFDWTIVPNPSGPDGGTGVAKLTGLVAFADTKAPEAAAKVFDYLLQPAVYAEFSARTLTIPAHLGVAASTIDYATDKETIAAALNAFAREVPKLQGQAIALDLHRLAPVYYEASNTFLRQYFAGELSLDEALDGIKDALNAAAG